jgi:carboxyl-terminal processing protease
MDRFQGSALAVAAVIALLFGAFSVGYSMGGDDDGLGSLRVDVDGDSADGLESIVDAFEKIRSTSVEPPSAQELARGAIKGMVKVLRQNEDPYALFFSPSAYRSFQELTTGRFSGIGVWLKEKRNELEIVSVVPNTPASESGIHRGDVITTVDGDPVGEMTTDEAVARIKGPEGTEVMLGIERGGSALSFTITRATIDLPNVIARVTNGDLGYIDLNGFGRGAGEQVRDEVEGLLDEGAEGAILDLRDNGGGLFSEAIEVASVFIEDGDIVRYKERGRDEVVYEAEGDAFEELPLVVLVNEGTASASEIVAGALQDSERGVIVGATTFGKGSVQQVVQLPDFSALKITTAAYYTPDGRDIDGKGIEPDVEVDARRSVQRERAVEILRGIVISTTGSQG